MEELDRKSVEEDQRDSSTEVLPHPGQVFTAEAGEASRSRKSPQRRASVRRELRCFIPGHTLFHMDIVHSIYEALEPLPKQTIYGMNRGKATRTPK
jgi:hypothetical protein